MSDEKIKGSCFCGAVQFEVNGEPTVMIYCHYKDCQAWSAGPINSVSFGILSCCRLLKAKNILKPTTRRRKATENSVKSVADIL